MAPKSAAVVNGMIETESEKNLVAEMRDIDSNVPIIVTANQTELQLRLKRSILVLQPTWRSVSPPEACVTSSNSWCVRLRAKAQSAYLAAACIEGMKGAFFRILEICA